MEHNNQPGQQNQLIKKQPEFTEIYYHIENKPEINYLKDFIDSNPDNQRFVESLNFNELESQNKQKQSPFDNIADNLYKKILKQGYIEKPSKVIKKNKKGDSDINYYNSSDVFINDDECCIEKKDKFSQFGDYKCMSMSIEELYESEAYKNRVEDLIIQVNKKKVADQFSMSGPNEIEKFDEIKKKIKKSIKQMISSKTNKDSVSNLPLKDGLNENHDQVLAPIVEQPDNIPNIP